MWLSIASEKRTQTLFSLSITCAESAVLSLSSPSLLSIHPIDRNLTSVCQVPPESRPETRVLSSVVVPVRSAKLEVLELELKLNVVLFVVVF